MSPQVIKQVDIAICTWNRDALLAQTLDSISRVRVPAAVTVSVLVVDNNSTDHTSSVVNSFAVATKDRLSVERLTESQQGHTVCRNRAIDSALGDLLVWTDDDVIVAPDWVEQYVEAANSNPEVAFWGSVIEPIFPDGCPDWIQQNWDNVKGCYAARDLGRQPVAFDANRLPYGANYAIRTSIQKQFPFSTHLGRSGSLVMGEDELDVFRRILAAGHQGHWVPDAKLQHVITSNRTTERYAYDYFVGQGRALVTKQNAWHDQVEKFKSEARAEYWKYKLKRRFSASPTWVSHLLRSALAQGQYEALNAKRQPN